MISRFFLTLTLTTLFFSFSLSAEESDYNPEWIECTTSNDCVIIEIYCDYRAINSKYVKEYEAWESKQYRDVTPIPDCFERMEEIKRARRRVVCGKFGCLMEQNRAIEKKRKEISWERQLKRLNH